MTNQPVEEKWKEDFDKRFYYLWKHINQNGLVSQTTQHEAVKSFIENLLEQERKRIEKELVRLPVYYSKETPNTLVSLSSTIAIINK